MSTEFNAGVQMSLNGNLEVFPLEEVLRLLARSRKSGCLRVDTSGAQGRIFLSNGTLSLATTANDVELRRKLVASGLVDEATVRKIELSGSSVANSLAEDVSINDWADFVREESVEGLYRIRRTGRGSFDFVVDLGPRYPTGQSFDSEVILSEADRRALEWEDIETVLPRLDTVVRMVATLEGEESVTLGPATWQILAALGGGASTSQVASTLQWSEFRTARETATLVRNGLVVVSEHEIVDETARAAQLEDAAVPESDPGVVPVADSAPVDDTDAETPAVELPAEGTPSEGIEVEAPEVAEDVAEDLEEAATEEFDAEVPESPSDVGAESDQGYDAVAEPETTVAQAEDDPFMAAEAAPAHEEPAEDAGVSFWEADQDTTEAQSEPATPEVDADQIGDAAGSVDETEAAPSWWSDEPAAEKSEEEPESQWGASPWTAEAPAEQPVIEATPWGSPVADPDTAESVEESPIDQPDATDNAGSAEEPATDEPAVEEPARAQGWWAETMGAAEEKHADADSEADRFLESVFSSLSNSDDEKPDDADPDETGFGMGLLRRRRMGATARDVENDG